ncbi:GNAT family N-acetyltransferase [Paenibacillus sp. MER TA 81-3]|uniref:GNAT family N-acetyltransferase n=1 Tax=Paenibacillus sp. MER TA 81-3 TaxID=2939573 RepID=UPI002041231F|nr:GNAT family N-acetyltransferase [Paenibacillus sp. MER TA 81-3]MCM3342685.1 GNAT family N-acetyltransferase [Paenibacillus sp. MER TA 81-3]
MDISLFKSGLNEASIIHEMQIKAFMPLLDKYQDYETSPANESVERIIDRLNQSFTDYYIIKISNVSVGAIRIVKKENKTYRISPIFILPEHQGKGIAQKVFSIIENMYNDARNWELETILQEQSNCYLYEKLGYQKTGEIKQINDKMTIVFYDKRLI